MHYSDKKFQTNKQLSLLLICFIFAVYMLSISTVYTKDTSLFFILTAIGLTVSYNIYRIFTKKYRERKALKQLSFPREWQLILENNVRFYQKLSEEEKRHFETEVQIFLHETRVTGINTEVDDLSLVLVGASAIIPVFGFPNWEYENLGEVLLYPTAFNKNFNTKGKYRNITGMVGTGIMQGMMILSKPALIAGFQNPYDKQNVGIHEFVHLLDAADGVYDGVPHTFLKEPYLIPWLKVMEYEMEQIHKKKSKINPYGGTKKVEFFAVVSEYFFEQPLQMQRKHPELYKLLEEIFRQDTKSRFRRNLNDLFNYTGKTLKGNAICPCGSGRKFKNCCSKNARLY